MCFVVFLCLHFVDRVIGIVIVWACIIDSVCFCLFRWPFRIRKRPRRSRRKKRKRKNNMVVCFSLLSSAFALTALRKRCSYSLWNRTTYGMLSLVGTILFFWNALFSWRSKILWTYELGNREWCYGAELLPLEDVSTSRKVEDESVCFASFIRMFLHAIKDTLCLFSFLSLEQFPYPLHNRLSFDHSNICMIHCKTKHSSLPFCFTSTPSASYSMDTFIIDS